MSNDTFSIIFFGIIFVGFLIYLVLSLKVAKAIHETQKEHYSWLKQGGGRIQNLDDYYTKEDLEG